MLVLVMAVPILRLRRTIDAATRAIHDVTDRSDPILANVNLTVENVNTTLGQVQTSLQGVNAQLEQLDGIVANVHSVSTNVSNLVTVVSGAAASPLVKVAAFGYGVRRAAANRRNTEEDREVRQVLKQQRKLARRAR